MKRPRRWFVLGVIAALFAASFMILRHVRIVFVASSSLPAQAGANATNTPAASGARASELHGRAFPLLEQRTESASARAALIDTGAEFGRVRIEETLARDPATGAERVVARDAFVAGEIIVTPRIGATRAELDDAFRRAGAASWSQIPASPQWLVRFAEPSLETKPAALAALARETAAVAVAEGNGIGEGGFTPNDPSFPSQYALRNSGQSGGTPGADVRITDVWDTVSTSPNVVVAVVDTGFTFTHPDLAANAYSDTVEIAGNGLDDDGNGFADDVHGWDFVNSDNDPGDDHDHGSHVSGIIGAVGNNGVGIAGVTWSARILPVKVLNATNGGTTANMIAGVNYARGKHARVMNLSLINYPFSTAMQSAVNDAEAAGILMCISAGNAGTDNDVSPNYPGSYTNLNVIAVANTTRTDVLNSGSNFGAASVDLAAPGTSVLSTVRSGYANFSGTSMSAPHVTGVAALILASRPEAGAGELRDWILGSTFPVAALQGKCATGGRLNASQALWRAGVLPPTITVQPQSRATIAGQSTTFEVVAGKGGPWPLTYQWRFNGVDIAGATSATYTLPSAQRFQAGSYSVVATTGIASATSSTATLSVNTPPSTGARLLNLSTRGLCLTGDDVLIPGFVVSGSANKRLLIRAIGPGLAQFGVPAVLDNPQETLARLDGSTSSTLAANDDWGTSVNLTEIIATSSSVIAFPLANGSADSALLVDLSPGRYSVVTSGVDATTGAALVELYDADVSSVTSRLTNISTRGFVGTGGNIMITGFVVSSEGAMTLLVRAIGPALGAFGVSGALADPRLTIFSGQTAILSNDDWGNNPDTATVSAQVNAFALPAGSKDAAFVVTLAPGTYTVQASGADGGTGVALVEIYAVP